MRLIVYVRPDIARLLRENGQHPGVDQLRGVADDVGSSLEPVHRDSSNQSLANAFFLEVADAGRAIQAAHRLRDLPFVEAAYVKPADEPPAG